MNKYILQGKTIVPEPNTIKFALWFETANRHVARDILGNVEVSTVFLGFDHNFDGGEPILFETMVFGGPMSGDMERYHTWEEAEEGHRQTLEKVKERMKQ